MPARCQPACETTCTGFNTKQITTRRPSPGKRVPREIREVDLSGAATRDLLRLHLAGMHANTPAGHVFALDLSGLTAPGMTVWTGWKGDSICGMAALKQLDAASGEVKSMRTHPDHLRQGVGAALLEHIIGEARARGFRRLSLETGQGPAFEPALA